VRIPIIHWKDAKPPVLTCVALDRTDGKFERNLVESGLKEGEEVLYFT